MNCKPGPQASTMAPPRLHARILHICPHRKLRQSAHRTLQLPQTNLSQSQSFSHTLLPRIRIMDPKQPPLSSSSHFSNPKLFPARTHKSPSYTCSMSVPMLDDSLVGGLHRNSTTATTSNASGPPDAAMMLPPSTSCSCLLPAAAELGTAR